MHRHWYETYNKGKGAETFYPQKKEISLWMNMWHKVKLVKKEKIILTPKEEV